MSARPQKAPGGKLIPSGSAWATHAALLCVQLAFASQAVEAKIAMAKRASGGEEIFPEALAMIRMLGGAVFFQAVLRARGAQEVAIARSDHVRLAILSVLGIALNQTLFLMGLRWTTPVSVSLLGATIPVFTAALAVFFGKEARSWRTAVGVVLSLSGVVLLVGVGSLDPGAVLVALNSLSYSVYVVMSRAVILRVGALRTMAWIFTYGALLFAPLGVLPTIAQVPHFTARGAMLVTYIVLVPTILAYLLNAWALARSTASLVTIYIYLQPLVAALLAWVQLGTGVPARAWVAAPLILLGLGVVATRKQASMPNSSR